MRLLTYEGYNLTIDPMLLTLKPFKAIWVRDKLVKKALKAGYKAGIYSDYSKDVIRPSAQECAQNGRARSTKMRWAVRAE